MENTNQKIKTIDPEFLCTAYCCGYFPMADSETGDIGWYSPDPRTILELDAFHVSRSLERTVEKKVFEIRINTQFEKIMRGCAQRTETWISEGIIKSYQKLFDMGVAHSVETWKENELVGGLYGVAIRGVFFGESMFSIVPDASKVALVHLVERLNNRGYALLDTQFITSHLRRFGAKEIPRKEYLQRLEHALTVICKFNE